MDRFSNSLAHGAEAEWRGNWNLATEEYDDAYKEAGNVDGGDLYSRRYYDYASNVFDLSFVYKRMDYLLDRKNPVAVTALGQGRVSFAQGKFDEAEKWIRTALEIEPESAQLQFYLAETLWQAGRYSLAEGVYETARRCEKLPGNQAFMVSIQRIDIHIETIGTEEDIASLLQTADLLRKRGRLSEAWAIYERVIRKNPNSSEALYNLGIQAEISGNIEEAISMYSKAYRENPHHYANSKRLQTILKSRED